jgi:hypothetical protein
MNPLAAPSALPGAASMPLPQGGSGRTAGDEPFARCLDRAVERDGAPRAAQTDAGAQGRSDTTRTRDEHGRADAGPAAPEGGTPQRSDDDRPGPETAHGAKARGSRRAGSAEARSDAPRALAPCAVSGPGRSSSLR